MNAKRFWLSHEVQLLELHGWKFYSGADGCCWFLGDDEPTATLAHTENAYVLNLYTNGVGVKQHECDCLAFLVGAGVGWAML